MKAQSMIVGVLLGLSWMSAYGNSVRDQLLDNAWSNGAEGSVVFRVIDDEGNPVEGVRCTGWVRLFSIKEGGYSYHAETDTNGIVTIAGKCSESFSAFFTKDGYYTSQTEVFLDASKSERIITDGKWQPYGETRTVVLKKIKNPQALVNSIEKKCVRYPEDGVWQGFDLERFDWCKPMGSGVVSDVMIRFTRNEMPDGYIKTLDVSFTNNQYAGAYEMTTDGFSEMSTVYNADSNATYMSSFSYQFVRDKKGSHCYDLPRDKYLVFRVRPVLDEKGDLVSAHYGRIYGPWVFYERIGMKIGPLLFNPTPNDTNLEDAETYRLSLLRKKQNEEFEHRRKTNRE